MGLHVNDNGLDFSVSVQDGESDSYHVWDGYFEIITTYVR